MSIFSDLIAHESKKKAVAYYRHSKDKAQENSVKIQRDNVTAYAEQFNIEIIHEEIDDGFTGINDDRAAFQKVLELIADPEAPAFNYVLVNDMSRWGRWQDLDEAAVFRFHCKKHGKRLVCVDKKTAPKEKEDITEAIIATVEAHNAARHVELISIKTTDGGKEVSRQGFSAGGAACYGLVRVLLDEQRNFVQLLPKGQHKFIANQRVTFTPANDETTENVKSIFLLFVNDWKLPEDIAEHLNGRGILSPGGKQWSRDSVLRILTNEAYIGSRIYYKTSGPLKKEKTANPREMWVIKENAFEAIIDPETFAIAQERLYWLTPSRRNRGIHITNKAKDQIKDALTKLLIDQGYNEDAIFYTLRELPIVFSVQFHYGDIAYQCFLINEFERRYEAIIGVGLVLNKKSPLDQFFYIPTKDFGLGNYVVFSETDDQYVNYQIKPQEIEQKILSLCMQ